MLAPLPHFLFKKKIGFASLNTIIADIDRNSMPGTDIAVPSANIRVPSADITVPSANIAATSADVADNVTSNGEVFHDVSRVF